MAGYLLIVSVLLLGGVIATVGDRLGYKIGKARLSWFNLRPRDTAVLITILTGSCISATTLGILFAASDPLRTGVFELKKIENKLAEARSGLAEAEQEKQQIEEERDQAQRDRVAAQTRLNEINQFLKEAQAEQQITAKALNEVEGKADRLRSEVERLERDRRELVAQRDQVRQQIAARDRELQQQETVIAARDQELQQQEAVIAEGKVRLQDLEAQQRFLDEAIVDLEQDLLLLRERRVVLARGEVLAAELLQVNNASEAEERVDLLLRQANQVAQRKTLPGTGGENDVVIQIPQAEVDRLIDTLLNGQPYLVRVLSAGNYITGESSILVFMDVSLNRVIFPADQVIASTTIDPSIGNTSALRDRINLLLSASRFRASQAGMVNDNIEVPIESLVGFLTQVSLYDRPLVIQAITAEPAYTVGPLRLAFLALENDKIIFRSNPTAPPGL